MSLQFIIGAGDHDHQKKMIDIACQWLENKENEVFFIVPNYNKFEREQEILNDLKQRKKRSEFSTIRSQVYSFHRLAWYFLNSSGEFQEESISEAGAAMLMRKVLISIQDQLTLFRGEIEHAGFIEQLLALYQEFQLGNIAIEQLQLDSKIADPKSSEVDFQLKMKEFHLIFASYERALLERGLSIEQPLASLTRYLSQKGDKKAGKRLFLISGFSSFSAQEQQLLAILMTDHLVCIDLLLERPAEALEPLDLFFEVNQTYQDLIAGARSIKTKVLRDLHAPVLQVASPDYLSLESCWRAHYTNKTRTQIDLNNFLHIQVAQTPEEEVRQVALAIKKALVNDRKLRYRDIQVLTLKPEIYRSLVPAIFAEAAIPFYIDEDKKMEEHPLVEFILALFSLEKYHYRQTDVLRFLRTELYIPDTFKTDEQNWEKDTQAFREFVDLTENKSLAYDYHGSDWTSTAPWQLLEYDFEAGKTLDTQILEEKINQIHTSFREDIVSFFETFKTSQTNQEAILAFYDFLIKTGIDRQLIHWRDQEIERGSLDQARNHEQTWQALMDLLDEFMEISGDDPFAIDLFEEVLSSGLANLSFGKIPTAIDQVQLNPLDLARPLQAKVTFAIGLDETAFPRKVENKTLLSLEERQRLNQELQAGQFLRDRVGETIRNEPFVAYNLFLSAGQKLYLSYATNYDTTKNIKASPYLKQLSAWTNVAAKQAAPLTLMSDPSDWVESYRGLIRQLNHLLRLSQDNASSLPQNWQILKNQLLASQWHDLAQGVFASQSEQNIPISLQNKTALALYGKDIYSSISRMETFYQCEYQYFMRYGLGLKERDIYGLNAAVTGEFFHDALDHFLSLLIERNLLLQDLSDEARNELVETLLKDIFGQAKYLLLNRSKRMNFIRYQLVNTIKRVTWALQKQSEKTKLSPVQTEVLFGQIAGASGLRDLQFPLQNEGKLHLRGKIDRIDTAVVNDLAWMSVIDYKSSSRSFDLTEAYYGLAMQLVTYLDVALTDAVELIGTKDAKVAGAYYLHVHDPLLKSNEANESERLKKFKYDGLFVDDPAVFEVYDADLEAKQNSLVFPIQKDKSDQLKKVTASKDKFYTEEEIGLLIAHNRQKMVAGGNRILTGDISLNPSFKVNTKKRACEFCPFRSICQFDVMLTENNYHRIQNLDKEVVFERIRKEEAKDE